MILGSCLLSVAASAQNSGFEMAPGGRANEQTIPGPQSYQPQGYSTYGAYSGGSLSDGLRAARSGNVEQARAVASSQSDPIARKLVLWAIADQPGARLSFSDANQARTELAGWPRENRRIAAGERALETAALSPAQVVAWFGGKEPRTAEGALALARAYQQLGRQAEAQALIRRFWREKVFEADVQNRMLARYGGFLTQEDHAKRADMLLYGPQGPATQAVVNLLSGEEASAARVRMSYRSGSSAANGLYSSLSPRMQAHPGVAFERAKFLLDHNLDVMALNEARRLGTNTVNEEEASEIWRERRLLINAALKNGDWQAAYHIAANAGLPEGSDLTEAEFYAGWMALSKLRQPQVADRHFARIAQVGTSPITQARAWYWRGRAAEAANDTVQAQLHYQQGARFPTTFYGQLAAEKAGVRELVLGSDPVVTAADRARFEALEPVRAARLLARSGETDLFKSFVLAMDDDLTNPAHFVQLVDLARSQGEQLTSMMVVRAAASKGVILPERGYPVSASAAQRNFSGPEPAFVHAIIRQESSFDPRARSGAGALGMMQLLPGTAGDTARKMGVSFSAGMLSDADYNIRLGSAYLGRQVENFSGSYVMAAAGYNAGPARPPQWVAICGDPRGSAGDPLNFIECIPFSETRNYVMRVMENTQVYRARLNGGRAPLTLSSDIRRGSYVPRVVTYTTAQASQLPPSGGMAPIPD
ncbi:MAG TPA: lytic transglycosylase domain-containing protein [Caulobacteraceae bacterium]